MFKDINIGDYVVYPPHGVGQFLGIEEQSVGDYKVNLVKVTFTKDRMTVKLPFSKAADLRKLSTCEEMEKALEKLMCKTKQKRIVWSRRAQEYESKINSGNLFSIAEVISDLFRSRFETDQSYSERQFYQIAVERFSRELAIVQDIDESSAIEKMENMLKAA